MIYKVQNCIIINYISLQSIKLIIRNKCNLRVYYIGLNKSYFLFFPAIQFLKERGVFILEI